VISCCRFPFLSLPTPLPLVEIGPLQDQDEFLGGSCVTGGDPDFEAVVYPSTAGSTCFLGNCPLPRHLHKRPPQRTGPTYLDRRAKLSVPPLHSGPPSTLRDCTDEEFFFTGSCTRKMCLPWPSVPLTTLLLGRFLLLTPVLLHI